MRKGANACYLHFLLFSLFFLVRVPKRGELLVPTESFTEKS